MVELIDERQSNDAYNEEKISSWKNNRINLIFRSSLGQFSFSQSNFSLRQAMKHFRAASGNAISVNSTWIPFFLFFPFFFFFFFAELCRETWNSSFLAINVTTDL